MASEQSLYIRGGRRLCGEAEVQGSKNATLPMLAASLLAVEGETVLKRVPPVRDVLVALEVLRKLGARVDYQAADEVAVIDATSVDTVRLPEELTARFRAALLFVGPLLARFRRAWIQEVGGCAIGARPVDYHYRGFARLGARVVGIGGQGVDQGIEVSADDLRGAFMYCDLPSHTGTENLIMAACLAQGESTIENAASDPEIADFVELLTRMGAQIEGAGTRTVRITGVERLRGAEHTVMHDRLDAGLLLMAAGITGGELALRGVHPEHLRIFETKLQQMGLDIDHQDEWTRVTAPAQLSPINVVTTYYPGFPTDLQPSIMALACVAHGDSYVRETVFEDRLGHVKTLRSFGARLSAEKDRLVVIRGPAALQGARVRAQDIRAGGACVLAGLAAQGCTTITNLYQLDRGYAHLETRLRQLGADLERT
ncbi:MAG: UDP-N-acetylglucosamine 1-carboxyvinyltransferase [Candidatus Latescibacterota bacterium]